MGFIRDHVVSLGRALWSSADARGFTEMEQRVVRFIRDGVGGRLRVVALI